MAENSNPVATAKLPHLRFLETVLFTIVMTIGLRWLPVAAAVGPASLPLWGLAFLTFAVPLAVATAELTSQFKGEGGLYTWVGDTYGPLAGFVCSWFYWIALLPYFAGIVYFISGLILTALGIASKDATLYLSLSLTLAAFVTAFQFAGLRGSKWLTNFGAAGNWLIFAALIALAVLLAVRGQTAGNFAHANWLPALDFNTAILWGTMVFAFAGLESIAFLQDEITGGVRTIVRVLAAVAISQTVIYGIGTAALLVMLPTAALTRLTGLPDAMRAAFDHAGFGGLAAGAIFLLALAMLGGFTAWFGIGTRLTVAAGADGTLPAMFARRHPKTGAPGAAIILLGVLTILLVLLSQAGAGAAAAYDFLVAMAVLTAVIPYLFMFAVYLKRLRTKTEGAWVPPGGIALRRVIGYVGQISTLVAIACTLVPNSADAHPLESLLKIVSSTLVATLAGALLYWVGNRRRLAIAAQ